jgi:hypothetical protein
MKNVMRFNIADYIDVTPGTEAETYTLMGTGFNKLNEDPGAKTASKTYIHEKSATTTLHGYESKFPYDTDMIADDAAMMFVYNIGRNRKTGADAQTTFVRVDLYDPVSAKPNEFKARKFNVTVEPDAVEGDGGEQVTTSGNLDVIGDPIFGTFNTQNRKFTADGAGA